MLHVPHWWNFILSPLPFRLSSAPSFYNVLPSCSLDLRAVLTFGTNFTAIGERFCLPLILPWLSDFSANQLGVRRLSEFIPHKLAPEPRVLLCACWFLKQTASFFLPGDRWWAQWGSRPTDVRSYVQVVGRRRQRLSLLGNIIWPVCTSQRLAEASLLTKATFHT